MKTAILTPAYGRDYRSQKDTLEDWEEGKDFILNTFDRGSTYVNINQVNDLKADGFTQLQFRFQQSRKTFLKQI